MIVPPCASCFLRQLLGWSVAWCLSLPAVAAEFVAGELLVKYRSAEMTALRSRLPLGVAVEALTPGILRVKLPPGENPEAVRARLAADPAVLHVQPNYIKRLQLLPDDSHFSYQWAMLNTGQEVPTTGGQRVRGTAGADVGATLAWDATTGDPAVVVAVIDTGIELGNPDLAANLWSNPGEVPGDGVDNDANGYVDDVQGWDWADGDAVPDDGNGHGTHIAGVIAARGNNARQIAGLNWRVSVMPLRTFDAQGVSKTSDIVAAIDYAVDKGVNIINASYGTLGGVNRGANNFDQLEFDAYDKARARGILVVAAACNEGVNNDGPQACVPASYNLANIIAVAASDQDDRLAAFSNWGPQTVDLAAPGANIATTPWRSADPGVISVVNGTSIASAFVTGGAALLQAQARALGLGRLSATSLRRLLVNNVAPVDALAGIVSSGGRLDIPRAMGDLGNDTVVQGSGVSQPGTSGGGALLWLLAGLGWRLSRHIMRPR